MSEFLNTPLGVYVSLNVLLFCMPLRIILDGIPTLKDTGLGLLIIRILFFPVFLLHGLYDMYSKDFKRFLANKPFKKANFEVGETVLYCGRERIIVKNEKMCEGDNVTLEGNYGMYTPTSELRKVSKLEKALK